MTERIRLTFFSDAEYYGGAERYLALLARHLDSDRYQLRAIVPPAPGAEVLACELERAGAEVTRFPRIGFAWMRTYPRVVELLRGVPGDVLHMNLPSSYDCGLSAPACAAKQAGYERVVTTEHLPMIERKYRRYPVKLLFSHWIDRIIAIAESNRPLLVRRHGMEPEKIQTLPNGVEPPSPLGPGERESLRAQWNAAEDDVVLGIVARLTRRKGHHVLLDSMRRISSDSAVRLIVLGEGEEESALRARAADLGLEDRVVWAGHREDAARIVQAIDLFVLPSTMETMPLTVLEAMAAGVAVVATRIYGVPELVEDGVTGLLVPPGDVDALARALAPLCRDSEERKAMGARGRERYEREFTAARMAERTAAIYESRAVPAALAGAAI